MQLIIYLPLHLTILTSHHQDIKYQIWSSSPAGRIGPALKRLLPQLEWSHHNEQVKVQLPPAALWLSALLTIQPCRGSRSHPTGLHLRVSLINIFPLQAGLASHMYSTICVYDSTEGSFITIWPVHSSLSIFEAILTLSISSKVFITF